MILLQYGFAKLFGAQFTVLDSELDKPMGTVSGFWLTWYYFGYSPLFGNLLGLVQVGLGLALAFRRTTLLGAARRAAARRDHRARRLLRHRLRRHADRPDRGLLRGLPAVEAPPRTGGGVLERPNDRNGAAPRSRRRWAHAVLVALLLAVPASCSYYVANYNNRGPTPLDGAWDVTAGAFQPSGLPGPAERVYFEHNRAYQVVLRSGQTWQAHHFEVDPATATIRIWRTWLSKGEQLLSGRYDLTGGPRLVVTATDPTSGQPLLWELRPVPPDQIRRGP